MTNTDRKETELSLARDLVAQWRKVLYDYDNAALNDALQQYFSSDCLINLSHPFETSHGTDVFEDIYRSLAQALPDLERRDNIVICGHSDEGLWAGCAGYYTGVFEQPWLSIPSTGHQVAFRFHEFFRIQNSKIVEVQGIWDLPQLMMQAQAWPMAPGLGVEWLVPGPATQDGLPERMNTSIAEESLELVSNMLDGLGKSREGGAEAMQLDRYWHPKMNWYGPAGIGTSRRISGFRYWHQIPFLNAMPDRSSDIGSGHLFADNHYVGFTAWPGMRATVSADGWMGIAPAGQKITMRSLDFWRCENGLIRENWVLVDLLNIYDQLGVDVFARMRELTGHRQSQTPNLKSTGQSDDDIYRKTTDEAH